MTLSMKEKKILYAYGCPSHHNTVTRLKWLTALTVDPEAKRRMLGLAALCTPAPAKLASTEEAVFASFTGSVSTHLRP